MEYKEPNNSITDQEIEQVIYNPEIQEKYQRYLQLGGTNVLHTWVVNISQGAMANLTLLQCVNGCLDCALFMKENTLEEINKIANSDTIESLNTKIEELNNEGEDTRAASLGEFRDVLMDSRLYKEFPMEESSKEEGLSREEDIDQYEAKGKDGRNPADLSTTQSFTMRSIELDLPKLKREELEEFCLSIIRQKFAMENVYRYLIDNKRV